LSAFRDSLPYFASFVLLEDESGTTLLRRYFERYTELARVEGLGLVLETPTWRANPDWATKLGYDAPALAEAKTSARAAMATIPAGG
jgi:homocysteine S-methyltransferase